MFFLFLQIILIDFLVFIPHYGFWINDYKSARQYREKPKLDFSLGVNTTIKITNNLNIITGFIFFEKGYKDNHNNLHKPPCIYLLGLVEINYNLTYISVPVSLEFEKLFSNYHSLLTPELDLII